MAKSKHTIRIISGSLRGRRLPVLDLDGLRPTGDRLRETLFNWLQFEMVGKKVLDLCAGTGALGFEALSRGAKFVVMVEANNLAAQQLQQISKDLSIDNMQVNNQTGQNYLHSTDSQFDIIFLDPPFKNNLMQELTDISVERVVVGGYLYREYAIDQELNILADNWHLYRQKTAGQVKIELWQRMS